MHSCVSIANAQCKSARGHHDPDAVPAYLRILDIHPVGAYAVEFVFGDGHRRGIFPWAYSRSLRGREDEADPCTSHQ